MRFFGRRVLGGIDAAAVSASAVHSSVRKKRIFRSSFGLTFLFLAISAVVMGSLGTAAYFYREYREALAHRTEGNEAEAVIAEISKIFELPTGEMPTLATVTDREKLSEQEFFSRAENGDQVLLYEGAKKAILFRPSSGKIINVAPIAVKESIPAAAPSSSQDEGTTKPAGELVAGVQDEELRTESGPGVFTEKVRVALLNGSSKTGVTHDAERTVAGEFVGKVEVVAKEAAVRADYSGVLVIDVSGDRPGEAARIAEIFHGSVGVLPDGETAPAAADILVLIGNQEQE